MLGWLLYKFLHEQNMEPLLVLLLPLINYLRVEPERRFDRIFRLRDLRPQPRLPYHDVAVYGYSDFEQSRTSALRPIRGKTLQDAYGTVERDGQIRSLARGTHRSARGLRRLLGGRGKDGGGDQARLRRGVSRRSAYGGRLRSDPRRSERTRTGAEDSARLDGEPL